MTNHKSHHKRSSTFYSPLRDECDEEKILKHRMILNFGEIITYFAIQL